MCLTNVNRDHLKSQSQNCPGQQHEMKSLTPLSAASPLKYKHFHSSNTLTDTCLAISLWFIRHFYSPRVTLFDEDMRTMVCSQLHTAVSSYHFLTTEWVLSRTWQDAKRFITQSARFPRWRRESNLHVKHNPRLHLLLLLCIAVYPQRPCGVSSPFVSSSYQ